MVDLSSYDVSALVHTNNRFSLHRARNADLGWILLKTTHRSITGAALTAFARDFKIAQQGGGPHLLPAHRLEVLEDGSIAQVRDDWSGPSVEQIVSQRLSTGAALRLMRGVLEALDAFHAA